MRDRSSDEIRSAIPEEADPSTKMIYDLRTLVSLYEFFSDEAEPDWRSFMHFRRFKLSPKQHALLLKTIHSEIIRLRNNISIAPNLRKFGIDITKMIT